MSRYVLVLLVLFSLKTQAQIQFQPIYKDIFWSHSPEEIIFGNDSLRLILDVTDGSWTGLYSSGVSTNILRVKTLPDVIVNGKWMVAQPHPQSLRDFFVFIDPYRKNVTLNLTWILEEKYEFTAHYALTPYSAIIERAASLKKIKNTRYEKVRVGGFRFELPHIQVGESSDCTVSIPGLPPGPETSVPPSTPYDFLKSKQIHFPSTPDAGFGMIVIENEKLSKTIAVWIKTQGETNCASYIKGNGTSILFSHDNWRRYSLSNGMSITSDKQVIHVSHDRQQIYNHYRQNFGYPNPSSEHPQAEEMVILRISPAHFKGGIKEITAKLTQYKETGFNTISLMPHWKGTWSPVDPFEVDSSIGSKEQLQNLVNVAQGLGFKVLFTLSVRGFDIGSPRVKEQPEMFYHNPDGTQAIHGPSKSVLVDWSSIRYQRYLTDLVFHDLQFYNIDGYQVIGSAYKGPNWNSIANPPYYSGSAVVELIRRTARAISGKKKGMIFLNESPGPIFHDHTMLSKDNGSESTQMLIEKIQTGKYTAQHYKQYLLQVYNLLPQPSNRVFTSRFYGASGTIGRDRTSLFFSIEALQAFFGIPEVLYETPQITTSPGEALQLCDHYKKIFKIRGKYQELRSGAMLLNAVRASDQNVFSGIRKSSDHTTLVVVNLNPQVTPVELEINPELIGMHKSIRFQDVFDSKEIKTPVVKSKIITTLNPFQVLVGRLTSD